MFLTIVLCFFEIIGIGMVFKYIFHAKLVRKPQRYILGSVILITLQYIFQYTGSDLEGAFGLQCLGWILPFFYLENYGFKKILNFHIAYNGFSMVCVAFAYVWSFITGTKYVELIRMTRYQILVDVTVIIILAVYGYVTRKKKQSELELSIGQSLVLFIGLWCFGLMIGFAQMIESNIPHTESLGRAAGIMLNIIALLFIVLSVWQQISWKRAQEYQLQNRLYENYLSMQEKHIRNVIQGDERMRCFRHDVHAHMTAISALLQDNRVEELKQYIERIQEKQGEWEATRFTGIYAVDAVIGEIYKKAEEKKIKWAWEGIMCLEESAEIYDMCVLFSNLLNNAMEACEKLEVPGEINLKLGVSRDRKYICVSNTCHRNLKLEDLTISTKGNSRYHGLGIRNVQEIVERKNGTIEYEIENGWLHAKVII